MDYVGDLPDFYDYEPGQMKDKEFQEFREFYGNEFVKYLDEGNWVLADTLEEYCLQDVTVLYKCAEKFRRLVAEQTGFDPFQYCLTLASMCLRDFQSNHMPLSSIGVIPTGGYSQSLRGNPSDKALDYMAYLSWLNDNAEFR
jgi:DNA polymerase family B